MNVGGPAYIDAAGMQWSADSGSSGGATFEVFDEIANTSNDALYQSERWDKDGFSYVFSVEPGTYTVTLYFAELYFTQPGARQFDVYLENERVIENLDIAAQVGPRTAAQRAFTIEVTDDLLTIDLLPGAIENPKLNALSVVRIA
jgi:hypothetical protein